jgi:hypothetical protein
VSEEQRSRRRRAKKCPGVQQRPEWGEVYSRAGSTRRAASPDGDDPDQVLSEEGGHNPQAFLNVANPTLQRPQTFVPCGRGARGWLIRPVRQLRRASVSASIPLLPAVRQAAMTASRDRKGKRSQRQKESPGGWEPRRDQGRCLGSPHRRTEFEGCRLAIRLIARFFGRFFGDVFGEVLRGIFLRRWFAATDSAAPRGPAADAH